MSTPRRSSRKTPSERQAATPSSTVLTTTPRAAAQSQVERAKYEKGTSRTVLSEEEYTATLSHLIQREFFPDLDVAEALQGSLLPAITEGAGTAAEDGGDGALTLANFQARYTSEDNASFQDLMQSDEKRRREAYRWAYEAEEKAKLKARNALFYHPPAMIEGGSHRSRERSSEVNHANTRLRRNVDAAHDSDQESQAGSETPRSSRIDAAIEGIGVGGSAMSDGGSESAQDSTVEGYKFVSPVPSPKPADLGDGQTRQLMTWGTIAATPRAVSHQIVGTTGADEGSVYEESAAESSFRIPPTPRRDELARRLADESSGKGKKRAHALADRKSSTSAATGTKRTRADLTPAARSLLDRTSRSSVLAGQATPTRHGADTLSTVVRQQQRDNERASAARLRNARWTPSPMTDRKI